MKNRLGILSTDFLKKYTKTLIAPETSLPAVQFKMDDENDNRCYFVGDKGCEIYEQRPWSCRMYPLDSCEEGECFSPIVDANRCQGLKDDQVWQLRDWFHVQGLEPYNHWNQRFAELTEDEKLTSWRKEHPGGIEIFHLVCYDLDRFRDVVLKERLHMIDPQSADPDNLQTDDLALLDFSFTWLKTVAELETNG